MDDLDAVKDELLSKKYELESINISDDTKEININNWNKDYQELLLNLNIKEKELEIAKKTYTDLFTEQIRNE